MALFEEADQLNLGFKSGILNEALALCVKREYEKAVEKFEEGGYAYPLEVRFRREIFGLEKDLEKETNEEIKENIWLRLTGFQQIVAAFDKKRRYGEKSEKEI